MIVSIKRQLKYGCFAAIMSDKFILIVVFPAVKYEYTVSRTYHLQFSTIYTSFYHIHSYFWMTSLIHLSFSIMFPTFTWYFPTIAEYWILRARQLDRMVFISTNVTLFCFLTGTILVRKFHERLNNYQWVKINKILLRRHDKSYFPENLS